MTDTFKPLSRCDLSVIEDQIQLPDGRPLIQLKREAKRLKKAQPQLSHAEALLTLVRGAGFYHARDWSQALAEVLSAQLEVPRDGAGVWSNPDEGKSGFWVYRGDHTPWREDPELERYLSVITTRRTSYQLGEEPNAPLSEAENLEQILMIGRLGSEATVGRDFLAAVKAAIKLANVGGYVRYYDGHDVDSITSLDDIDEIQVEEILSNGVLSSGERKLAAALCSIYNDTRVVRWQQQRIEALQDDPGGQLQVLRTAQIGPIAQTLSGPHEQALMGLMSHYRGW